MIEAQAKAKQGINGTESGSGLNRRAKAPFALGLAILIALFRFAQTPTHEREEKNHARRAEPVIVHWNAGAPTALMLDGRGLIYAAYESEDKVSLLMPGKESIVLTAEIESPSGLAMDKGRNLYVSSRKKGTIHRISPTGEIELAAQGLASPSALIADRAGNILAADGNGSLLLFDSRTGIDSGRRFQAPGEKK